MKSPKNIFSRWWLLYLVMALISGLFLFEVRESLSVPEHRVVEIGLVLVACGSAQRWARANPLELTEDQWTYKLHYTWLEEPQESRPLSLEKPGALEDQAACRGPAAGLAGRPVQEAFLSRDLDSVRAQVLWKN